ncbi:response regulator [Methylobacterium durans]|uniref:response regulator n=1 Tax=Methylobacterium durans TaxID=2202825 RepID=UPI002AFF6EE3|nr:response regulator [Methylobacterium durans]MEA1833183.1 response regulator [Methylobacterium durans]
MLDSVRIPLKVLNAVQTAGVAAVAIWLASLGLGDARVDIGEPQRTALAASRAFSEAVDDGLNTLVSDVRGAALLLRPDDPGLSDPSRSALLRDWIALNPAYRSILLVAPSGEVRAADLGHLAGMTLAREPWLGRVRNAQIALATAADGAGSAFEVALALGVPGRSDRLLLRVDASFFSRIEERVRRALDLPASVAFLVTAADGRTLAGIPAAEGGAQANASTPTRGFRDLGSPGWLVTARAEGAPGAGGRSGAQWLALALVLAAAGIGYAVGGRMARPLRDLVARSGADNAGTVSPVSEIDAVARFVAGRAQSADSLLARAGTGIDRVRGRLQTFEAMSGWTYWEVDPQTRRVIWSDRDLVGAPACLDRTAEWSDLTGRIDPDDHALLDLTLTAALAADGPHDIVLRTRPSGPAGCRRVLVRFLRSCEPSSGPLRLHALSRELPEGDAPGQDLVAGANERRRSLVLRRVTDGIVHDVNDVLTVMLVNLGVLRRRHRLDGEQMRLVDGALAGALRGSALTRRMLSLVRGETESLAACDLAATVAAVLPFLQLNILRGTPVIDRVPSDLPRVLCSDRFLEVMLLNVAFHFRDLGLDGFAIGAAEHEGGPAPGLDLPPRAYIRVLVASGRPRPGTRPRPASTRALEAASRLIAEAGGGWRLVADGTGEAAFLAEIWLPAAERGAAAEPAAWQPSLRILLVESDGLVRASLAEALGDLGHTVVQAASGDHALALLAESAAYDAMIADQSMPVMTGLQLAATVVERHPGIRIILASPHGQLPAAARRFLQLDKPFRQEDLAAILAEAALPEARAA